MTPPTTGAATEPAVSTTPPTTLNGTGEGANRGGHVRTDAKVDVADEAFHWIERDVHADIIHDRKSGMDIQRQISVRRATRGIRRTAAAGRIRRRTAAAGGISGRATAAGG
ncbi:hypothetical protein, partial [Mangrovicella endophytica]|uniref:hypothetical protein n=1 Tax=Mangrovicella endophytica TaxID=2066697 RepID=UPI001AECBEA0